MFSFTSAKALFCTFTNNPATANNVLGGTLINQSDADVLNIEQWDFLEATKTTSTVASQQYYGMPYDIDTLKSVVVVIGSQQYIPQLCPSRDAWNNLNQTVQYSDQPEWFYVTENTIGLYPAPSSSQTNALKIVYEQKRKDLSIEDYTTGTITTATLGQLTIVGSGTSWTSKMAGMWIKIADANTANTGDGYWYKILSVQSATSLTLVSPYGGISISGGSSAYVIGQTSLIPEDFQIIPIYKAAEIYYTAIQPDSTRAAEFKGLFNEGLGKMRRALDNKVSSPVIDFGATPTINNPNLFIRF